MVTSRWRARLLESTRGQVLSLLRAGNRTVNEIGGSATICNKNGKLLIRGNRCPLAAVTAEYPEACLIVEALLAEGIGARVKERCVHTPHPSCRFEID